MNLSEFMPVLIVVGLLALSVSIYVVGLVKRGGLKAALFGVPVQFTAGEIAASSIKLRHIAVKVHALEKADPERAIGLEFIAKGGMSYRMISVSLSEAEAKKLATLLQSAVSQGSST